MNKNHNSTNVLATKNKFLLQSIFAGISCLLSIISLIAQSAVGIGWITFVGLGLGIYAVMSSIGVIFTKDRNILTIIATLVGILGIVLCAIGIFCYIDTLKAFIGTMV